MVPLQRSTWELHQEVFIALTSAGWLEALPQGFVGPVPGTALFLLSLLLLLRPANQPEMSTLW